MMDIEIDEGVPYEDEQPVEQIEEVEQVEAVEQDEPINDQEEVEQEESQPTPLPDSALKAINKKHFQYKEEERQRLALQKELDDLKAKMQQQPQERLEVPPVPDRYDYDTDAEFNQAVEERDSILRKAAAAETQKAQLEAMQIEQQQREQLKKREEAEKAGLNLLESAKQSGITEQALTEAVYTIGSYGLGDTFATELMNAPNSAQLIASLANNPLELEKLSMMSDYQKGVYFATNILPKAEQVKPKLSNAPKPPKDIRGRGADPDMGRFNNISGATFE